MNKELIIPTKQVTRNLLIESTKEHYKLYKEAFYNATEDEAIKSTISFVDMCYECDRYFIRSINNVCVIILIHDEYDNTLHLENIFVDSRYRGLGYGSLLIDYAIHELRKTFDTDNNKCDVILNVNKLNTNAIHIYEHFGFRKDASLAGSDEYIVTMHYKHDRYTKK